MTPFRAVHGSRELSAALEQLGRPAVLKTAAWGYDGKGQIRKIKIDPTVVNASDVEMLEDLVLVAVVEAQKKAADLAQEEMGKLAGGMNLPFKLPF